MIKSDASNGNNVLSSDSSKNESNSSNWLTWLNDKATMINKTSVVITNFGVKTSDILCV